MGILTTLQELEVIRFHDGSNLNGKDLADFSAADA
jgi:hypothetical protein